MASRSVWWSLHRSSSTIWYRPVFFCFLSLFHVNLCSREVAVVRPGPGITLSVDSYWWSMLNVELLAVLRSSHSLVSTRPGSTTRKPVQWPTSPNWSTFACRSETDVSSLLSIWDCWMLVNFSMQKQQETSIFRRWSNVWWPFAFFPLWTWLIQKLLKKRCVSKRQAVRRDCPVDTRCRVT